MYKKVLRINDPIVTFFLKKRVVGKYLRKLIDTTNLNNLYS